MKLTVIDKFWAKCNVYVSYCGHKCSFGHLHFPHAQMYVCERQRYSPPGTHGRVVDRWRISLVICLFIHSFTYLFICLLNYLLTYLLIYLRTYLLLYLFVHSLNYMSVYFLLYLHVAFFMVILPPCRNVGWQAYNFFHRHLHLARPRTPPGCTFIFIQLYIITCIVMRHL